jgi:hypothetical protein
VSKAPPELPNIEDATLRACLAPLMDAMNAGMDHASVDVAVEPSAGGSRGSNDNPPPGARPLSLHDRYDNGAPGTLAEWRALTDDEFGAFRMIERFLAMTDAERDAVAAEFPRQIGGTVERIARIKRRLSARYDIVTTALALLERAAARR